MGATENQLYGFLETKENLAEGIVAQKTKAEKKEMEIREVRSLKKQTEQNIRETENAKDEVDSNIIFERTKKMWIKAMSRLPGVDKTKSLLK